MQKSTEKFIDKYLKYEDRNSTVTAAFKTKNNHSMICVTVESKRTSGGGIIATVKASGTGLFEGGFDFHAPNGVSHVDAVSADELEVLIKAFEFAARQLKDLQEYDNYKKR